MSMGEEGGIFGHVLDEELMSMWPQLERPTVVVPCQTEEKGGKGGEETRAWRVGQP